jgi:hypothetical protein
MVIVTLLKPRRRPQSFQMSRFLRKPEPSQQCSQHNSDSAASNYKIAFRAQDRPIKILEKQYFLEVAP